MQLTAHAQEIESRFAALRERIAQGQVARGAWKDAHGRVCLLLALAPEVGDDGEKKDACPVWLLPQWLVWLTPWIDDACSIETWPATICRYADVVGRAALVLDADAWRRLDYCARRAALRVAREYDASKSCDRVIALCDREIAGDSPSSDQWAAEAAATAAQAAAWAAEWAEWAARAATTAWAATTAEAAARAARAATTAARAATTAWAATTAATAATTAEAAARAARAADKIIAEIFDAIEAEIARAA